MHSVPGLLHGKATVSPSKAESSKHINHEKDGSKILWSRASMATWIAEGAGRGGGGGCGSTGVPLMAACPQHSSQQPLGMVGTCGGGCLAPSVPGDTSMG